MKGFALILLCLVAVQARYTGVQQSTRALAALGENPWVVHLRIAVATSGFLNTCAGSLINERWLLTAASCAQDLRFVWTRYGAVNVINPSLVTENSQARAEGDLALISINRFVQTTDNIRPVELNTDEDVAVESARFCAYGGSEDGPGDELNCYDVAVERQDDGTYDIFSEEVQATRFDLGAPLVVDGVQIGVLVDPANENHSGKFANVASSLGWIEDETGIAFTPEAISN